MWGKPEDVPGECNAHCYIADDYGDNSATIRCGRAPKHDGKHREAFEGRDVVVEWAEDEREEWMCRTCGRIHDDLPSMGECVDCGSEDLTSQRRMEG